jgi:hypothetical protein
VPFLTQRKKCRKAADDNIPRHMRFACWITETTDTHSEYVTLIAFPRQKWLHKQASMLCYVYTACLVIYLRPIDLGSHSRNATMAYNKSWVYPVNGAILNRVYQICQMI